MWKCSINVLECVCVCRSCDTEVGSTATVSPILYSKWVMGPQNCRKPPFRMHSLFMLLGKIFRGLFSELFGWLVGVWNQFTFY